MIRLCLRFEQIAFNKRAIRSKKHIFRMFLTVFPSFMPKEWRDRLALVVLATHRYTIKLVYQWASNIWTYTNWCRVGFLKFSFEYVSCCTTLLWDPKSTISLWNVSFLLGAGPQKKKNLTGTLNWANKSCLNTFWSMRQEGMFSLIFLFV